MRVPPILRVVCHTGKGRPPRAYNHRLMSTPRTVLLAVALLFAALAPALPAQSRTYGQLLGLFQEWRIFEEPPRVEGGVPDYSAGTNARRLAGLQRLQERLRAIDTAGWSIPEQVDHHLVRAEMNGMEYHLRTNLAGANAKDLWVGGVRAFEEQSDALGVLGGRAGPQDAALARAIAAARTATDEFAAWLRAEASKKTGPSGIGKDNYTWFLRNVLLVPLSWEDEVTITRRELARAHASLRLEENRNRLLPPLEVADTPEAYDALQERAIARYLTWVADQKIHVSWTPRGWMRRDPLLGFEQHLYLRQPGYGASCITGGRLMEETIAERARQLGDAFSIQRVMDEINAAGMIPASLIYWEVTGDDRMVRELQQGRALPVK